MFFSYKNEKISPAKITLKGVPLPWVDSWPHLGNQLNIKDLSLPYKSSMNEDCTMKRRKFIGKFNSLKQEFGFLDPELLYEIIDIYATSFYGSSLWLFTSTSAEPLFTNWNSLIRVICDLPNTTHKYFIEDISNDNHIKSKLFKRSLTFISSLTKSKKICLAKLALKSLNDCGSITKQNIDLIERESGLSNVLANSPEFVISKITYAQTPDSELWRTPFLTEMMDIRKKKLSLPENFLTEDQLNDLIKMVATS